MKNCMRLLAGLLLSGLLLSGCGPTPEQIAGTGLTGLVLAIVAAWLVVEGVERVRVRLATGQWPAFAGFGPLWPLAGAGLVGSALAWTLAPQVDAGTVGIVLGCSAANLATWGLLVRVITGCSTTAAVVLATLLSMGPAVGAVFGIEPLAMAMIFQWAWGGLLGGAPASVAVLIWLVAWLRGRARVPH